MVLAIGLLVDDAIVVENVERVMQEEGLSPKEAIRKSMGQIQGALVGIALKVIWWYLFQWHSFWWFNGCDLPTVPVIYCMKRWCWSVFVALILNSLHFV